MCRNVEKNKYVEMWTNIEKWRNVEMVHIAEQSNRNKISVFQSSENIRKFFTCQRPSQRDDLDQRSTGSSNKSKYKQEQHKWTAFAGSVGTAVTVATMEQAGTLQTACPQADIDLYIKIDGTDDSL